MTHTIDIAKCQYAVAMNLLSKAVLVYFLLQITSLHEAPNREDPAIVNDISSVLDENIVAESTISEMEQTSDDSNIIFNLVDLETSKKMIPIELLQAETMFLGNNLNLIAERFNIDIQRAILRQKKLWPNPEISVEHQVLNRTSGSGPIGFGSSDNTVIEIEQILFTAGKRSREIRLQELELEKSQIVFDKVLLALKRDLREKFFRLAYLERKAQTFENELDLLEKLSESILNESLSGDISRLHFNRIQTLLIKLWSEYDDYIVDIESIRKDLNILLGLDDNIYPLPILGEYHVENLVENIIIDQTKLILLALENRSDLALTYNETKSTSEAVRLELARSWPDLGLGVVYDRFDGMVDNYWGITLNMEVPLWNRNQGNIRAARVKLDKSNTQREAVMSSIVQEVKLAVQNVIRIKTLLERIPSDKRLDLSASSDALIGSYKTGQISLTELIDYLEAFRKGLLVTQRTELNFLIAVEELRFTIGTDVPLK